MAGKRIEVEIVGNPKSLSRALGKAHRETGMFGSKLGGVFRGVGRMAAIGTKAVVGLGAAFAGAAIFKGGQRLIGIDNATAKLRGLGHDAASVKQIMDDALASVLGTSFGLDKAATAAASAVAAGIKPGKQLERYLKLIADAATIAGTDLDEMGAIINKTTTAQKVYTQELNQLADRGLPVFQWLQKEYGVSAVELRKMVSKGEVDAKRFQKVIEKNIGGAALESGKTVQGSFRNLGAAMGRLGAAALAPAFGTLPEIFGRLTGVLDGLTAKVGPLAERFGDFISEVRGADGVKAKISVVLAGGREALGALRRQLGELLLGTPGKRVPVRIDQFKWTIVGKKEGLFQQVESFLLGTFDKEAMFGSEGKRVPVRIDGFKWTIVGGAKGWVNELQDTLEAGTGKIDWGRVGNVLGKAGGGLAQVAGTIAALTASLIGTAIRKIDWVDIGTEIAEGMAKAASEVGPTLQSELEKVIDDKLGRLAGPTKRAFKNLQLVALGPVLGTEKGRSVAGGIWGRLFGEDEAQAAIRNIEPVTTAFGKVTAETGLAKGATDKYRGALDRLPKLKTLTMQDNLDEASRRLRDYRTLISSIPSTARALFGGYEGRQHGGPVLKGLPYIVGEKRPELFIPNMSGRIVPRVPAMAAAGGGGGQVVVGGRLQGTLRIVNWEQGLAEFDGRIVDHLDSERAHQTQVRRMGRR